MPNTNRRGYREIDESQIVGCECGERFAWIRSNRTGSNYRAQVVSEGEGDNRRHFAIVFKFHGCSYSRPIRRRNPVALPTPRNTQGDGSGAFAGIVEMFRNAGQNLRFPRIRFENFTLSAINRGPNAGGVNITDGRRYPNNTWYGRIDRNGTLNGSREMTPGIGEVLARLAIDPSNVAAAHGHATGSCCFCARDLTDARSTSVGYGPICAGHYGLAWGSTEGSTIAPPAAIDTPAPAPAPAASPAPIVESGKDCSTCGDRHTGTCAEFAAVVA